LAVDLFLILATTIGFLPAAASAAGCTSAPTPGTVTRVIGNRTYTLNVPPGLTGPAPLLVSLHGTDDTSAGMEAESGWSGYAAAHHFIVAYPQGIALAQTWHFERASIDVTFLTGLVRDVESTWCVDKSRVYAEGWSNGGIMAQRLACDAADTFTAVAGWESTDAIDPNPATFSPGSPCAPSRSISVGIFQGQFDPISNPIVGVIDVRSWLTRNNCARTPVRSADRFGTLTSYRPCAGGAGVVWRSEFNTTHQWPAGCVGEDLRDRIWHFLSAYTLA
jgi:polyhydroxybutyrate depolymerase